MFQSDALSTKLVEIRNRIESNINEAAYVAERHQTQMGVLGQARRNAQTKLTRPMTSKYEQRSKPMVLAGANSEYITGNQELKGQTIHSLNSKTDFKFQMKPSSISHTDKAVKQYLGQWAQGKTALPQDWHAAIDTGKITNNHNYGLIVGRKMCQMCNRYRCAHQQFSGGVNEQQKLELQHSEAGINIKSYLKRKGGSKNLVKYRQDEMLKNLNNSNNFLSRAQSNVAPSAMPLTRGSSFIVNQVHSPYADKNDQFVVM